LNDRDIGKTHFLQGACGKGCLSAAAAGQDDLLLTIGKRRITTILLGIGFDFELAARDVAGAGNGSALAQLPLLADIDQQYPTRIKQTPGLFGREHRDGFARLVHALAKGLAFAIHLLDFRRHRLQR
jgi:hypothetical protein